MTAHVLQLSATCWPVACAAALLMACAAPAESDDWGDGDQVTLEPRVDWSGRGVPDGGWGDAGPVVVEYDAASSGVEVQ